MKISRRANVELVDGEFLRVFDIIRNKSTSKTILRGWLFRRTKEMNGLLHRKSNELCLILHIDEDDKRESSVQGMESVPIEHVRKRRLIKMTNRPFPELSWREDGPEEKEVIFSDRVLICRYKYICTYADADARRQNNWCEKALFRLQSSECDKLTSMEDEVLRFSWRGETVKGGLSRNAAAGAVEVLEQERHSHSKVCIDLTIDDYSLGSSTSRENGSKGSDGAGAKRSIGQVQWGQYHSSKRINAGSITADSSHRPLTRSPTQQLRSDDEIINFGNSERAVEPPSSSASIEVLGIRKSSLAFESRSDLNSRAEYPNGFAGLPRSALTRHNRRTTLSTSRNTKPATISPQLRQSSEPRYTFGDCFCGAGGTSRGAKGAGLRIDWGFDFNFPACQSFKMNFPAARVYNIWAHEFASLPDQDHKVDICHLSPPCQYFSDAHTIQGKDDEMNTATLFSVHKLLDKARPRVVTLEQTAGLLRRHSHFFNALVLMFTERGFSIRWRLLQCADYGLPQHRLRLFMIAAW